MTTKEKVLHAVENLPDDATVEDAMERLLFLAKVERGIRQADAGQTIPHAQVRERTVTASTYTAVMKQDGGWWIGWIEEVPGVNCQERTRQGLLDSLRTTLTEALELNREDALRSAAPDYTEATVSV